MRAIGTAEIHSISWTVRSVLLMLQLFKKWHFQFLLFYLNPGSKVATDKMLISPWISLRPLDRKLDRYWLEGGCKGGDDCEQCHRQSCQPLLTRSLCHRTRRVMCTTRNRQRNIMKDAAHKVWKCYLYFWFFSSSASPSLCPDAYLICLTAGYKQWGSSKRRLLSRAATAIAKEKLS